MSNPNNLTEQTKQIGQILFLFDDMQQSIRKSNEPEFIKKGKMATNLIMATNDIEKLFTKPQMVKNQNTIALTQLTEQGEYELRITRTSNLPIKSFGNDIFIDTDLDDIKAIKKLLDFTIENLER
jgi:hypothetical protein